MATVSVSAIIEGPDANVFPSKISDQITATNEIGNHLCYVLQDGGVDEGVYCSLVVPADYVGSPAVVVGTLLAGTPGASDTIGFGVKGLSVADNEAMDAAYGAEDTSSGTVGSTGSNHANEDRHTKTITLSNLSGIAPGEEISFYAFLDSSATSYIGKVLLRPAGVRFQYANS